MGPLAFSSQTEKEKCKHDHRRIKDQGYKGMQRECKDDLKPFEYHESKVCAKKNKFIVVENHTCL